MVLYLSICHLKLLKEMERAVPLGTLSTMKLAVPLPGSNCLKNSCSSYSGATLWNSLPCNLRETKSLGKFKRLLHLIDFVQ